MEDIKTKTVTQLLLEDPELNDMINERIVTDNYNILKDATSTDPDDDNPDFKMVDHHHKADHKAEHKKEHKSDGKH